jgi:hypothetical protein
LLGGKLAQQLVQLIPRERLGQLLICIIGQAARGRKSQV